MWSDFLNNPILRREDECEWCKPGSIGEHPQNWECSFIDDDGHTVTDKEHMVIWTQANYCPVCGKRLED